MPECDGSGTEKSETAGTAAAAGGDDGILTPEEP